MTVHLVYITAGSMEQATAIADALVGEGLAACCNLLPGMTSVYRWEGQVQHDQEIVVLAKTTAAQIAPLTERVVSLHDYDVPCVVALLVTDGHGPFLTWVRSETGG